MNPCHPLKDTLPIAETPQPFPAIIAAAIATLHDCIQMYQQESIDEKSTTGITDFHEAEFSSFKRMRSGSPVSLTSLWLFSSTAFSFECQHQSYDGATGEHVRLESPSVLG